MTTGILHTRFKIHALLAGILVMTALYWVNLRVMGKSNVPLVSETTLATRAESLGQWACGGEEKVVLFGWEVAVSDISTLVCCFVLFRLLVAVALRWGLNPNDLKLVTAVFVFAALVVPRIPGRFRKKAAGVANA